MNGITTININGKPITLRFAYPAIRWFAEACKDNKEAYFLPEDGDGGSDFSIEGMAKLIQCSYWNECLVKEQMRDPSLNYEAFYLFVSEKADTDDGKKELAEIIITYADSSIAKKAVEEKKRMFDKSQILTGSNPSVMESLESDPGNSPE